MAPPHGGPGEAWAWLRANPGLDELCEAYPDIWAAVQQEMAGIFAQGKPEALQAFLQRAAKQAETAARTSAKGSAKARDAALHAIVRQRMIQLALKKNLLAAASGVSKGKIRFNLFNGFIAQRLLFARDLVRKPVSLFWFRLLWPLVWQKKRLMPLVQSKGIYCFYSRPLIKALASLTGGRTCLEIAAGDGTLTRFLREEGVAVTATDDGSWSHVVTYPEDVVKLGAQEALARHAPEVVICSWPPAGNPFERAVFTTPSVQTYIVIGSRLPFAAGNWDDYRQQTAFSMEEDPRLGRYVLPPELEAAVYIFRRKTA